MSGSALAAAVEAAFEVAQLPWLARLVELPSHTAAADDVERAAGMLDEAFTALGWGLTRHPDGTGRGFADHRVYESPALAEGEVAPLLVGHVDTVFPRRLGFLAFAREGDVLRGPGVLDMKGGLSSVVFALRALRATDPEAFARLKARAVCVSDEEVGSPSSRDLYTTLAPRAREALVFESGRAADRIVVARRGSAIFRITAHGRAAHAGNKHQDGVNAIHALAALVGRFEGLTEYDRGVTVNVGLFEGGTAKNTVPDRAECTLDVRFLRGSDGPEVEAALRAILAAPGWPPRLADARLEMQGAISRPPMEPLPHTAALRARYEAHAAAAGLGVGVAPLQGGGSDANLLAAAGVPCLDGLGPYGEHFHQVSEWASAESLRRRTVALATYLAEEAGGGPRQPP